MSGGIVYDIQTIDRGERSKHGNDALGNALSELAPKLGGRTFGVNFNATVAAEAPA